MWVFHGSMPAWLCMWAEETFTNIDRVATDYGNFMKWVEEEEKQAAEAAKAVAQMRSHPWYPHFLEIIGAADHDVEWGSGDPVLEVATWEEWRRHAEDKLLEASREGGAQRRHEEAAVSNPSNMETQIVQDC